MNRLSRLACRWLLPLGLVGAAAGADETLRYAAKTDIGPTSQLVVHGALDLPQMRPLLEGFHRENPDLEVRYRNLTTLALHERFLVEPDEADVLLSSAMPWQ